MRKGSKKAANNETESSDDSVVEKRARRAKGAPPVSLAHESQLRVQASKCGAVRARLVLKHRCGSLTAPERVELLTAHINYGAVKHEQGFEAHAEEIFREAYNLTRDLLRQGETLASLHHLVERLPRELRKILTTPPAPPPTVRLLEPPVVRPQALLPIRKVKPVTVFKAPKQPRTSKAIVAASVVGEAVVKRRRGRPSVYNRNLSGR